MAQVEGYARSVGLDMAKFRAVRDGRRSRLAVARYWYFTVRRAQSGWRRGKGL